MRFYMCAMGTLDASDDPLGGFTSKTQSAVILRVASGTACVATNAGKIWCWGRDLWTGDGVDRYRGHPGAGTTCSGWSQAETRLRWSTSHSQSASSARCTQAQTSCARVERPLVTSHTRESRVRLKWFQFLTDQCSAIHILE